MTALALPALVASTDAQYTLERYTVQQAAAYLDVSVHRIYRDIGAQQIACRRDGARRIKFSQADLDAWRQAKRVEVAAPRSSVLELVKGLRPLPPVQQRRFS